LGLIQVDEPAVREGLPVADLTGIPSA
jgi:hypothetical protein